MNDCKNANDVSMLLKLIVVNSQHVVRYKSKITHCSADSTLSEYLATVTLDDGNKNSIDEALEVLIGAGTFTNMSCFDKQNFQVVKIGIWQFFKDDLKAIYAQRVLYLGMIHMKIRIGVNVGKDISEST